MGFLPYTFTAFAAYLLGSIPTGYLVAKAKGIDIRTVGSGNIGATNAMRVLGKPAGIIVLIVDALKGWLAVWSLTRLAIDYLLNPDSLGGSYEMIAVIAGLSAIVGHIFTCWLKFKGGKGIATTAGVLLAIAPGAFLIVFAVWIVIFAATRYVSVGSIGAAVVLPFVTWLTIQRPLSTALMGVISALAIYKHKTNIQRLLNGTEHRFGEKNEPTPPPA